MSIDTRYYQYGKIFDHWQIRERIGQGSGGKTAVFRICDTSTAALSDCALKSICLMDEQGSLSSLSPSGMQEFEQARCACTERAIHEVQLMDVLQKAPNVVRYQDYTLVDWEDGTSYGRDLLIRMELLTDLRSMIRKERNFSEEEIIQLGIDICSALDFCHEKNIIHRDIKPENIFLSEGSGYNGCNQFKLGDFGISKILCDSSATLASTRIGTPQYAAPEQFLGAYDGRVDIYSLGLVLYELCNENRLPFAASGYAQPSEIVQRLQAGRLPALPKVSPGLSAVIQKACSLRQEHRYRTAKQMKDALEAVRNACTRVATPGKIAPPPNRVPWGYIMGGLVMATVLFTAVGLWLRMPSLPVSAGIPTTMSTVPATIHLHDLVPATCEKAAYCNLCGETLGNPLGHTWNPADCTTPETCTTCHTTRTPALGHTWNPADCTTPETCTTCHTTRTPALGHTWNPADCTTPEICTTCHATRTPAMGHDWLPAGPQTPMACSRCNAKYYSIGNQITFGRYEQDNVRANGPESLQWNILDKKDDQILVISTYCIERLPYHSVRENVSWETCSLRKWLNEDFLNTAFTQDEQKAILTVENENPSHPIYGTSSGRTTQDQLFLLTLQEAELYFGTIDERKAAPTDYVSAKNAYMNDGNGLTWWWLRTTSYYRDYVTFVTSVGGVSYNGREVNRIDAGVRPAMWIRVDMLNELANTQS